MYSPQIALPLLLVIVSPSVFADQAAFKNGDRLTGAILKSDAKSLLMTTAVAGEVTVSWQEIQELRSDLPLHVVLANGKKLVGRMKTREGKVKIVTDTGDTVEASKESVVVLRNNAEQLAYEKSQHGSLLHGWDGGLDAGFELSRGTSKTRNFRFAFGAVRKELTLYAESLYSIDDVAGARPHVTANVNKGGVRFDHDFVSRLFLFANTDFMTDGLQDLNLRSVLGGGIGYHLINRDNATLNLLGGANFTRENYVEVQRNLAAAQVGEEFTLKLGKGTTLLQNLAFFPDLTNSGGNYRTNFSLRTVTPCIAKRFSPKRKNRLRFSPQFSSRDGQPVYLSRLQVTTAGGDLYLQCRIQVLYRFLLWQMLHNRRRPTLSSSVTFSTRVPLGLPWKT